MRAHAHVNVSFTDFAAAAADLKLIGVNSSQMSFVGSRKVGRCDDVLSN